MVVSFCVSPDRRPVQGGPCLLPMVAAWLEPMDVTFDTALIKHTNMHDEAVVLVWFLSIKKTGRRKQNKFQI